MGVAFDKLYFESQTYLKGRDEVLKGLEKGVFYQKEDGSIWIDLTEEGLDQKALLRKDGTAMYITQDIGTAILRFEDYPDTISQIYTVGNEQEYHFKVLFKVLKKLGWEQADACHHLSYGMVELPAGKMKSREGTVVDADDLMEEMRDTAQSVSEEQGKLTGLAEDEKEKVYEAIGMSALKYFLLRVDPKKNMMFNPEESIDFNGNTGPFVQYGYVRTQAIRRKAADAGIQMVGEKVKVLNASERELIKVLYQYPSIIDSAALQYDPSIVANFAYDVVRHFNTFYQSCSILREEDVTVRSLRMQLCELTGQCVQSSMGILGIQMPERM
jgi:arginyl-tRNA synthetase